MLFFNFRLIPRLIPRLINKLITSIITIGLFALIISCGENPLPVTNSPTQAIIGADQRQVIATKNLADLIGSLAAPSGKMCTAFISGTNTLTSAAHCLDLNDGLTTYRFITASHRQIQIKGRLPFLSLNEMVRLEIEPQSSFLPAANFDPHQPIQVVGYDLQQNNLLASALCSGNETASSPGILFYACDTVSGFSGSPILQGSRVIGIHAGHDANLVKNVGILLEKADQIADSFFDHIQLEKKVELCSGTYVNVGWTTAAWCSGAFATALVACPTAVSTGGVEPISGSSCALGLLNVKIACVISLVAAAGYTYKCLFE